MIYIRESNFLELNKLSKMGNQKHVDMLLSHKSLETHKKDFIKNNIIYLSILSSTGLLAGYFILRKEKNTKTVQFKRILIDEKHLGIGQEAILAMEKYCKSELKANRIWLDVYEKNSKATHIYEKLGYKQFERNIQKFESVLFYEKNI